MDDRDGDRSDRGRAVGTLLAALALAAAVTKCLANPDSPFPEVFCTRCALVALLGLLIATAAAQLRRKVALWKALVAPPTLAAAALFLAAAAAATYRHVFQYRIAYARVAPRLKAAEDHVDLMLQTGDERLREYARRKMGEAYSAADIERGYVKADLRAVAAQENFQGKGLFLAVGMRDGEEDARVTLTNLTLKSVTVVCHGPQTVQLPIPPNGKETFRLKPGDYRTSISATGDHGTETITGTKHVVAGTIYRGNIIANEDGDLLPQAPQADELLPNP